MNWASLKTLAATFVHRKDIDWNALQPLCADEINLALWVQENEGATSVTLAPAAVAGFSIAPLPLDFCRPRAVFAGAHELQPIDIQAMLGAFDPSGFYAISGNQLWASTTSVISLIYSKRLALLGDAESNVVLDRYSGIYLYGVLKHAAHRIQDFDAEQSHQAAFDASIATANAGFDEARMSAGMQGRSGYAPAGGVY